MSRPISALTGKRGVPNILIGTIFDFPTLRKVAPGLTVRVEEKESKVHLHVKCHCGTFCLQKATYSNKLYRLLSYEGAYQEIDAFLVKCMKESGLNCVIFTEDEKIIAPSSYVIIHEELNEIGWWVRYHLDDNGNIVVYASKNHEVGGIPYEIRFHYDNKNSGWDVRQNLSAAEGLGEVYYFFANKNARSEMSELANNIRRKEEERKAILNYFQKRTRGDNGVDLNNMLDTVDSYSFGDYYRLHLMINFLRKKKPIVVTIVDRQTRTSSFYEAVTFRNGKVEGKPLENRIRMYLKEEKYKKRLQK